MLDRSWTETRRMLKRLIISLALAMSAATWAADGEHAHVVDLRADHALDELKRANPAHFEKIRQVIAALQEQPTLAEGDWLRVTVAARDVDLSRFVIRTSYPPKQLLQFTLDDTRYMMHLVRNDLTPQVMPAK
jgi:hypothetical protein